MAYVHHLHFLYWWLSNKHFQIIFFFVCTLYLVMHVIPFTGEYNWQNKSTINLNKEPDHLDILYIVQVFEFRVCFSNFQRVFLFFDFWIHSHCWNVLVTGPKIVVLFLDFLTWNQKTYQDYKTWSFYAEINSRQNYKESSKILDKLLL